MPSDTPDISIIVPALNEALNLPLLAERIDRAMAGKPYEILIIDDRSTDDTPRACAELAARFPLRLIVRENPTDGLSGAVLHGMGLAGGQRFVVMDADLQHPPEKIPELLAALDGGADFALGSRYIAGGSTGMRWGISRKINSWIATFLARPFAGRVSDPMSGFFALDRETFVRAERLTPLGYKIALELMCKCRVKQAREVPIHFAERVAGDSKLTLYQQFRYLEHLSRLYDFCYPRISPIVKFTIATGLAWVIAFVAYNTFEMVAQFPIVHTPMAYFVNILVTLVFHSRYVRTQRPFLVDRHPWRDFLITSLAELITCAAAVTYIWRRVEQPGKLELFLLPFIAALFVRYVLRKELLLDIRGLRREIRQDELF